QPEKRQSSGNVRGKGTVVLIAGSGNVAHVGDEPAKVEQQIVTKREDEDRDGHAGQDPGLDEAAPGRSSARLGVAHDADGNDERRYDIQRIGLVLRAD